MGVLVTQMMVATLLKYLMQVVTLIIVGCLGQLSLCVVTIAIFITNVTASIPIRNIRWTRDSMWTNLWIQTTSKVRKQYFRCHHL
ncbi:unnamed protein product, partial [Vitis vinifera]|uniref:Uncharacterized protein n=1 Tax=Vitis vinifera TaxID=29760 RepID=D7SM59_VITVI